MKNFVVRTLVTLSFSALLSPLALLAQEQLNATIPFAFNVGAKTFAPGDYSVHQLNDGHILQIRSQKDGAGAMTPVMESGDSSKTGTPVLTFKRYGDRYFLSAVSTDSRGWRLFQSKTEKEIAKAATPGTGVEVAAFHSK
jgi:hypothetical protein